MSAWEYIRRVSAVHKCVSCRTILGYDDFDESFCPTCKLAWQSAKVENCPDCYKAATECSCMPKQLSSAGALTLRRLFFYSPKREKEPQNRLIYFLKHNKNARASCFVASQLAKLISSELETLGIDKSELLVVNVPRGRAAVLSYGFDQAAEISKELAKILGASYLPVIKRRRGGKEQKKLRAAERKKNIKDSTYIKESEKDAVSGRYILLVDDIVTTGASMAVSLTHLRRAGAKGVICLAVASDLKKEIGE
jgi:ComF family protein